jgi:hypothetical protein
VRFRARSFVIGLGVASTLAVAGGALVRAQQGPAPVEASSNAPPDIVEAPPPPESALSAAAIGPPPPPTEASDVEPAPVSEQAQSSSSKAPPPMKRPRYTSAVIQALDKVTAQTLRFEAPINKPIRYKSLIFVVRDCETTAPDEGYQDAMAHVEIDSQPLTADKAPPPKQIFRGWMFANSPGVHLFQHPVYDAWLIACKTDAPSA